MKETEEEKAKEDDWENIIENLRRSRLKLHDAIETKNEEAKNEENKDREYAISLYENIADSIIKDGLSIETITSTSSLILSAILICAILGGRLFMYYEWIGAAGISFFMLCLISNAFSCIFAKNIKRKIAGKIIDYIEKDIPSEKGFSDMTNDANRKIDMWDSCSVIILTIGIILTAIFVIVNAFNT
jgi:hypothetical protein